MTALPRATFCVLIAGAAIVLSPPANAQSALLQGGSLTPGHVPMYVNSYSQQPIVLDSGPAAGGPSGVGLSELGLTMRGNGPGPYANAGSGPGGTNFCDNDGPTTGPYHALCFSPNAQGGGLISYNGYGGASQLPLTFQINGQQISFPFTPVGTPLSSVAVTQGLNPLPVGSPLYNWGLGIPSTVPGNVADPLGFYPQNGGIFVYKPYSWGTEDRACAGSFIVNAPQNVGSPPGDSAHCGVMGTLAYDPSRVATYQSRDSVALYASNSSIASFASDNGATAFTTTTYVPSVPLTSSQVASLRTGMLIDAGGIYSTSKYTGTITGWSTSGTSVTVSGWFQSGNQASGQIPSNGTSVVINPVTKIWAANFSTDVEAGGAQNSAGIEMDVTNNSAPVSLSDPYAQWGYDVTGGGTYGGTVGYIARGKFLSAFTAQTGTFAGFSASPQTAYIASMQYGFRASGNIGSADFFAASTSGAAAFEAVDGSGNTTFQVLHNSGNVVASGIGNFGGGIVSTTGDFTGEISAPIYSNGVVGVYGNLSGVLPTSGDGAIGWNYSSGSAEVDFINLSSSPGNSFGFYQGSSLISSISPAGLLTASGFRAGASTGVSCSGSPTSSFASVGGIVTHC
jgi:hypothetical protein